MTGKDLEYKPGVVAINKLEYSPLGEALKKALQQDKKVKKIFKYEIDFFYDSVHNFNRLSVSNFDEITSVDPKFDTQNSFYKDFK